MTTRAFPRLIRSAAFAVLCANSFACGAQAPPASSTPTADEAGYAYGINFGYQLYTLGVRKEIPIESLMRGMQDGLAGKKTSKTDIALVQDFIKALDEKTLDTNRAAASEFLTRNRTDRGVKTTASGLQYTVVVAGDVKGRSPAPDDVVLVRYRGQLLDGTEFDRTDATAEPTKILVSAAIKGWQEAMTQMKPGAKWKLFVPPELGYDSRFKPGIPKGSLLIFDVELVGVEPQSKPGIDR